MVTRIFMSLLVVLSLRNEASAKNIALETNDVADHFVSSNINLIFDVFLKHYTKKLIEEGKTQIKLADFERRFSTRILSMDIEGAFEMEDGWCGNVSTLHRTGDADMDRVEKGVVLSAHLGLSDLRVDYNSYDISLLGVHQKGTIHVTIGENSLRLQLNVQLKPSCLITLSKIQIEKLNDIDVDITNLGIFENLTDDIVSWVVSEVTKEFRQKVDDDLYPVLAKAVTKADICHYLPF